MNQRIPVTLPTVVAAAALLLMTAHSTSAQYVVSARGGLVNYTTGPVTYRTAADPDWKRVPTHLQLDEGDRLKTQNEGKAEILLMPGSFLRLANNAELAMLNTDLTSVTVELVSGSAILEIGDLPNKGTITVQTPITTVRLKKEGLYRIDIVSDAMTLTVREGEAHFLRADGVLEKVKKNRRALIIGKEYELAKFDPNQVDDFDLWSADRAELLVAANQSLVQRMGVWSWPRLGWNSWIFDPFFGCYTFLPWGYSFWSPYGYGYFLPWGGYSGGYGGSYGGGYAGGTDTGGNYGGQAGSPGPGGSPPVRATKPWADQARKGREVVPSSDAQFGVFSGRTPRGADMDTRIISTPSGGYMGGSNKAGGGYSGGHSGGAHAAPAPGGHAAGSGKASGGSIKQQ
ncbi:MAG: FecR domain-containing protein [Acidobacteriota bacterium]|nr:FecR domain-containing protein [Blastocatellia bacterium]MDW8241344.1 FecR domain-containing protein [Acidobacteriota bacterium]